MRTGPSCRSFENVYTGVDKTSKRAATLTDIKHIKQLDLSDHKSLEFARDIFLFLSICEECLL